MEDKPDGRCNSCNAQFEVSTNGEKVFFFWDLSLVEKNDYIAEYYFNAETNYRVFELYKRISPYNDNGHFLYASDYQLNIDQIKRILELKAFL